MMIRPLNYIKDGYKFETMRYCFFVILSILFLSCDNSSNDDDPIIRDPANCDLLETVQAPADYELSLIGAIDFTGGFLESIQFVNEQVGFALGATNAGSFARALKTTDGGANWEALNFYESETPQYLAFKNEMEGVLAIYDRTGCPSNCQNKSVLYKTTNGGLDWTKKENEDNLGAYNHPQFGADGNLYVYINTDEDYTGRILRSSDLAETWEVVYESDELDFNLVTFSFTLFEDKIYASGKNENILVISTDGELLNTIAYVGVSIYDLEVIDDQTIYMANPSTINKTTDAGFVWGTVHALSGRLVDMDADGNGLAILSQDYCSSDIPLANDYLASTTDGGLSWTKSEIATNLRRNYQGAHKINDNSFYLAIDDNLYRLDKK